MWRDGTQYNNYAEVQYEIPFLGMKRKLHNKNKLESYKEAYTTYEINGWDPGERKITVDHDSEKSFREALIIFNSVD
jgi:hypothetical protein